jgi:integrase
LPKYSLHKSSGQATVKHNEKVHYLGPYGSDESKDAYTRLVASLKTPAGPPASSIPTADPLVGHLILAYYEFVKDYFRKDGEPTSEVCVIHQALRVASALYAETPCSSFGPRALQACQDAMIARGWCRKTINRQIGRIRAMFKWGVSRELLRVEIYQALATVMPLQAGRTRAKERAPVGPVSDSVVDLTLPRMSKLAAGVIRVMRLSGARPGEILSMKATDIDRTDPECWRYEVRSHKNAHHGKTRTIFLGPKAIAIIAPRILKVGVDRPLFPLNRNSLRWAVRRACKRAGVPPWFPNQIRHTVATEIKTRFGLESAQILLGHARASTTEIYAARDLRHAAEVARKIG